MKIIDIHTHIYPKEIAQKATDSVKDFYHISSADMNGTVPMLLERGYAAGIRPYVVLPVAIRPDRVRVINDSIVHKCESHPEFVGFGTVHPAMDDIAGEAECFLRLKLTLEQLEQVAWKTAANLLKL